MTTQALSFRLLGKLVLHGRICLLTGLHIGGAKEGFEIGGLDNPTIKLPQRVQAFYPLPAEESPRWDCERDMPYIPASSLKGKMRHLVEWCFEGRNGQPHVSVETKEDGSFSARWKECEGRDQEQAEEDCPLCTLFGHPAVESTRLGPTRLRVWDAYPDPETVVEWKRVFGEEGPFSELKMENSIDRVTSMANPRGFERAIPGSRFVLHLDFFAFRETDLAEPLRWLFVGLRALEEDYLGRNGSRGYGRLTVEDLRAWWVPREWFRDQNPQRVKRVEALWGAPSRVLREWEEKVVPALEEATGLSLQQAKG